MTAQTPPAAQTLAAPNQAVVTAEVIQRIAPSETLLRAIQAGGWSSLADLAEISGRNAHNMKRDLGRLEESGLVDLTAGKESPVLTPIAVAGLAAIDNLTATPSAGAAQKPGEDYSAVFAHKDFTPNPDQPRKRFNPEAVSQRRASIVRDGLLQNLLARPNPDRSPDGSDAAPALQIVSGETRWRAIGEAIEAGELPADFAIKTDVRHLTDEQVLSIGLVENMQRSDLSPLEEARAFAELIDKHGRTTAEIAETVSKSQRFVQIRLSLLTLTPEEQAKLESEEIGFKEALRIIQARPKPLDLTSAEALILAEVLAAAAGERPASYHHWAECAPDTAERPEVKALIARELLTVEGPDHFTGRFKVRFKDYLPFDRFARPLPALIAADRGSALLSIRASALGADEAERLDSEGGFATPWLNGPFDLTPEGAAIVEQRRQEAAANAVKAAETDAQRALRMKRLSEADAQANDLLKGLAKPRAGAAVEGFAEVLNAAEAPLPWSIGVNPGGWQVIFDANGKSVEFPSYASPSSALRLKLIMAAVNAAAGFAPAIKAADAEDDTEDKVEERECEDCHQVFDTATEESLCPACASEAAASALGEFEEDESEEG